MVQIPSIIITFFSSHGMREADSFSKGHTTTTRFLKGVKGHSARPTYKIQNSSSIVVRNILETSLKKWLGHLLRSPAKLLSFEILLEINYGNSLIKKFQEWIKILCHIISEWLCNWNSQNIFKSSLIKYMPLTGLEPASYWLPLWCSIPLRYGGILSRHMIQHILGFLVRQSLLFFSPENNQRFLLMDAFLLEILSPDGDEFC